MEKVRYEKIYLKHYSSVHPIRSALMIKTEKALTISITNEIIKNNYLLGDPVVVHQYLENSVDIYGCIIEGANIGKNRMVFKICDFETFPNKRKFERHPVSLYVDISTPNTKKRIIGTIRNISPEGILVLSKEDFQIGTVIDIELYTENNVISLKGLIMRKRNNRYNLEYGLKTMFPSYISKEGVRRLIDSLEKAHDEMLFQLKKHEDY